MKERKILIADDEPDILILLEFNLNKEGYLVYTAKDGIEALELAQLHKPEVILLDIMMPEKDGIEVCRLLRSDKAFEDTTIVMLTARGEEYSEIAGFDAGADDYIVKPIKLRSLMKRLEKLQARNSSDPASLLNFQDISIDFQNYRLLKSDLEIRMPKKEFELLYLLASNQNKVISRERILEEIWGKNVLVVDRTIDVHIRRIRKKIGEEYIQTLKGVGYKFHDIHSTRTA